MPSIMARRLCGAALGAASVWLPSLGALRIGPGRGGWYMCALSFGTCIHGAGRFALKREGTQVHTQTSTVWTTHPVPVLQGPHEPWALCSCPCGHADTHTCTQILLCIDTRCTYSQHNNSTGPLFLGPEARSRPACALARQRDRVCLRSSTQQELF